MTALSSSRRVLSLVGSLAFLGLAAWCSWHFVLARPPNAPPVTTSLQPTAGLPWFVDVTRASGIDFQHFDSATDKHHIFETMGSGAAWIDYDGDGWLDLFLVQDGPVRPSSSAGALPTSKLYRNNGDGTFSDVTVAAGLARPGYGMGCAVGDYDNDGHDDLVVSYLRGLVLYHNEPDGQGGRRFVEVTERAGLVNPHWGTSCAWADLDGDGLLDLYVCNYVEIDLDKYVPCYNSDIKQNYGCPPGVFKSTTHRLFRNRGDGRFEDVSQSWGIAAAPPAPGLGVVIVDLDGDGRPDIFVANDMQPAYLFHNQGSGKFVEKAWCGGVACMLGGRYIAGMCADAGDVDGSGRPSLFVTNFHRQPSILFVNKGRLLFQDWSHPSGVGPATTQRLGFGGIFCDVDLDGHLDVAIATGHVWRNSQEIHGDPYRQQAKLFVGDGQAHFRDVSEQAGAYFHEAKVGRGLAWADYNNDGLPDLLFTHNADRPVLLKNGTTTQRHWLRLELQGDGQKSNRNAIGARVEVEAAGRTLVRFVVGGGSYLSACERRLLLGLDQATQAERVTVRWPSGRMQVFGPLAADAGYLLREGEDKVERRR
jgi:hypothetical protein